MYDNNKNHVGFIAIEADISERKEIEHRLQKMKNYYKLLILPRLNY
jgi:hypothetical protein